MRRAFLGDNLFDAVVTSWVFLSFCYADNIVAAAFYGPQSRVKDGVLARANCVVITMLWSAFKVVMVPIGARLATLFSPGEFAVVFMLIWGSYIAADTCSDIGGAPCSAVRRFECGELATSTANQSKER